LHAARINYDKVWRFFEHDELVLRGLTLAPGG
jgi:hypothetical protein